MKHPASFYDNTDQVIALLPLYPFAPSLALWLISLCISSRGDKCNFQPTLQLIALLPSVFSICSVIIFCSQVAEILCHQSKHLQTPKCSGRSKSSQSLWDCSPNMQIPVTSRCPELLPQTGITHQGLVWSGGWENRLMIGLQCGVPGGVYTHFFFPVRQINHFGFKMNYMSQWIIRLIVRSALVACLTGAALLAGLDVHSTDLFPPHITI